MDAFRFQHVQVLLSLAAFVFAANVARTEEFQPGMIVYQKTEPFTVTDHARTTTCSGIIFAHRIITVRAGRLYVNCPACRGWAPTSSVVPSGHARDYFADRIRRNPEDWFAYLMSGIVKQEEREAEVRLRAYDEAVRLADQSGLALLCRGRCRLRNGDLEGAREDFDRAARIDPANPFLPVCRGKYWCGVRDWERAEAQFLEASRAIPDTPFLLLARGYMWWLRRDRRRAMADCDNALRLDPDLGDAYFLRSLMSADLGNQDRALSDLGEAIRLNPQDADALVARGTILADKGHQARALADLDQAIKLDPKVPRLTLSGPLSATNKGIATGHSPTWIGLLRSTPGIPMRTAFVVSFACGRGMKTVRWPISTMHYGSIPRIMTPTVFAPPSSCKGDLLIWH